MGSEMAYNLFSKRHALDERDTFVVCDAIPEAAQAFARNFESQFPRSRIRIVETPEEYVHNLSNLELVSCVGFRATVASATVITMLPSSPQVRTVYAGTHGVLSALRALSAEDRKNTICIDSTTLDVDVGK